MFLLLNFSHTVQIFRCTIADLTKTNKTLVSEINILKRQTEEMNQLQTKRELQLSNLMKTRDSVLKKLKVILIEDSLISKHFIYHIVLGV